MVKQLESVSWVAAGLAGSISRAAFGEDAHRRFANKLEELVLRVRRAGLLFIAVVTGLLALSLVMHPIGLLLWLIALPLAVFASLLSMLWPTRRFSKQSSEQRQSAAVFGPTLSWLSRRRGEIPLASRAAFDLVIERARRTESLVVGSGDILVNEAQRLIGQHLPRLIQSFLALPPREQTDDHTAALMGGLAAIAEELEELNERLLASRTDRFETERRFIENRYPRRNGLAKV